jgi:diketogulonate reductase-like aldo/keto reductase
MDLSNIFGTYKLLDEQIIFNTLRSAYDIGYRVFDCAELYKNQHIIGKFFNQNNIPRESIFISSKVSFRTMPKGESFIRESINKTLSDLNISYIDLMIIHSPEKNDILTWNILSEYKQKGIIKNIGLSNYNELILKEFITKITNPEDIFCNQIEFNPFLNRSDLISLCKENNILLMSYGNLYKSNNEKSNNYILMIAEKLTKTPEQVLLRYAQQKGFHTITMATEKDYIRNNIDLDFTIDIDDFNTIDSLNENYSLYKRFI